jgi:hypothetical protein
LPPKRDLTVLICHLGTFVAYWTGRLFLIVEYVVTLLFVDSLALVFVDKLRQIPTYELDLRLVICSNLQANRIENVRLSGTVRL